MKSSNLVLPGTLLLAAALGGCGSGSDPMSASPASTTSESNASAVMISATQQSANALVAVAGDSTLDAATAQAVSTLTSGADATFFANTATVSGDYACSALGVNGSGSIAYTGMVNVGTGVPQSLSLNFEQCMFTAFLNTYSINGTESTSFSSYTSPTQFALVESWDVMLQISGSWMYNRTFNGSATCTEAGGSLSCSYDLKTTQINAGFAASLNGSVVTVSTATLASQGLTLVLHNWVYDAALGYATAGSITVTDMDGNTATITADGNGTYTVTETINGVSYMYTVSK